MDRVEDDLTRLLDLLARMIESMKDVPTTDAQGYAETLARKVFFHLGSALYLARGTKLPRLSLVEAGEYRDIASIAVVIRTAFEAYITLCFLFAFPADAVARQLRFEAWRLSVLRARERLPDPSPQAQEVIEAGRQVVAEIAATLQGNAAFQDLKPHDQKRVLDGRWRAPYTWPQLAERFAWLPAQEFGLAYGLLSSYAHSDFLSAMHLDQADAEATRELVHILLRQARIVACYAIFAYARLFEPPRQVLAAAPERMLAEEWCLSADLIQGR